MRNMSATFSDGTVHGSYKQGPGPAQPSWKHLIICYVCCMQCYKTVIVTLLTASRKAASKCERAGNV